MSLSEPGLYGGSITKSRRPEANTIQNENHRRGNHSVLEENKTPRRSLSVPETVTAEWHHIRPPEKKANPGLKGNTKPPQAGAHIKPDEVAKAHLVGSCAALGCSMQDTV